VNLHHVNIVTDDMPALDHFYQDILGLRKMQSPPLIAIDGYSKVSDGAVNNPASFLDAGDPDQLQIHLCRRDVYLGARYGHSINPVSHGHVAFRCDDIEEMKKRLENNGIRYSDYGEWAVKGWYQIFFYDPAGTVVEVHQVL
jgi:catechol 2,3-dioxygenase-like lactoylglutathione lyase family enzyme